MPTPDPKDLDMVVYEALRKIFPDIGPAKFERYVKSPEMHMIFPADLVVVSEGTQYATRIVRRVAVGDIAAASLMKLILAKGKQDDARYEFIILAKVIPRKVRELAEQSNVHLIQVDWDFPIPTIPEQYRMVRSKKITSEAAWRVACELIATQPTSIRRLSKATGVSYGWAHATVNHLIELGVADRVGNKVQVKDPQNVLASVVWERPLEDLHTVDLKVLGDDALAVAREVGDALKAWKVQHAFTALTATSMYTHSTFRYDTVYLYIQEGMGERLHELEDPDGRIILSIYAPDRSIFSNAKQVDGLTVADPTQVLLDLAGMGYAVWDVTKEMMEYYVRTVGR